VLLGTTGTFTVTFDNTSTTDTNPTDVGYGPYIDLFLPATGADGRTAAPNDGISFVSATYLGTPVVATVLTLTAAGVAHPYAKDTSGNPLIITPPSGFFPGDQLVVLQVPYGSFTPDQPPAAISVTAAMSNLADVGTPLPISARGGFQFGTDPLDNPATDPSLVGTSVSTTVTPTLFKLTKTYIGPEDETATGPNFPRQYQISVDVATGQTITDLDLTDILPPELQFIAVTSTSGATTAISTPSTSTPGGTLTRQFASVTGTASTVDAQMTFSFYVPRVDAPLSPIIDPTTGDDVTATDDASTSGTWDPLDPRDATRPVSSDVTPNDHTLTLKSIATQKTSSIVNDTGAPGLSPGDTIEYTINFQVSDYFAFQNLVLTDLFSDGQNFVPGSATYSVSDGHTASGSISGAFAPANFTLTPNITGGSDQLLFLLSQQLAAQGFSPNGRLVGGAIPAGGTGGPPPQSAPPLPFGPTQGTITFRTVVQDRYEVDFPSGDPSLDQGDPISNNVTISGDLLNVSNLTPNGQTEDDNSSTVNKIVSGSFTKTVYAINGVRTTAADPGVAPGDTVTYRLTYNLPTGDAENFRIEDFLPLPIFDVDKTGAVTVFDRVVSGVAPTAGHAQYGPADTSFARTNITPGLSRNSGANSVVFNFGTFDDPLNLPTTLDILFTVTVSNDPFADQLLLTNGAQATSNNTVLETTSSDTFTQVQVEEPVLNITKGVVATNNPAGTFSPGAVGPVAFNAPGTTGARFTGTINSANLAATPINSNLSNIDQSDVVTFAVVVENTGSSPAGAFNVLLRDTFPEGFLPTGVGAFGINLRVTDGAGHLLAFTSLAGGAGIAGGNGGIQLVDPSALRGAIGPGFVNGVPVTDGSNIVIITYDLISSNNQVNQVITDVATVENYASQEGGPNFVPNGISDDATVRIATPQMTKDLVGTEIVNTTNANNEAVIGELVTYRVRITVPEGTTPSAVLTDTLDPELAFVGMVSSNLPAGVTITGSFTPVVTNSGQTIMWTLGNIVNNNATNAVPEVIELVYRAVVINTADSNAGDQVNNGVKFTYATGNAVTAAAPNVTIIEPQVNIDKSVSVDGAGDTGDAGDPFVYTIVLSNKPGSNQFTADAFDLTFRDLLQAGLLTSPLNVTGFTVTDSAGVVTAANFELVTDPGTGQLVLQTKAGTTFDLPVSATRTITIHVSGNLAQTVTPGQLIPNDADVRWTSLDGIPNPNPRSTFNTNSTERTGAGGVNDYVASDEADIHILNVNLQKSIVSTSETATTDSSAVVVGEIVRYRVQVAIPDFASPTRFQFADLLPAGMQLLPGGTGKIALVSDAGDTLISTTLTDPDPNNPPDLYLTGNENNVATLVPQFAVPAGLLSFTTVNGQTQFTFDLGLVTNPANASNDLEYVVAEFNVLVTNTAGNQAGTTFVNQVASIQDGTTTGTVQSPGLRLAEPAISGVTKSVVSPTNPQVPDNQIHDAGDVVRYAVNASNGVGPDVSTAYDVRVLDTPPAGKMVIDPSSILVFRNGVQITTGFTNNSTATTVDVTLAVVAPGDTFTVSYAATLTTTVVAGETIPNTANVTWTSLPGPNGTTTNPTGSATPGASGAPDGERNGADGAGGALNDYAGTASAVVPIGVPDLDKNILDTSINQTISGQFDPNLVDLTIGETVTYRITITVPEGTTTLNLTDVLPTMNAGTVTFVSAQVAGIGGNISGSALAVGAPGVVSGSTITFNFGTVINLGDNVVNELDQITVDVVGKVTNVPENVAGTLVTNTATLQYDNGTITDDAVAEIVEPILDIQKDATPAQVDASSVVIYTVVVSHVLPPNGPPTSTAAAFNVLIQDLLNAGNLQLIPGTVTVTGSLGATVTLGNNPGDTTIRVQDAVLLLGETLTITYRARVTGAPAPGSTVPNTATLDWSSSDTPDARPGTDSDPAQVTVNTNSISGLIYTDLNNNGIYEPGAGETLIITPITVRLTGTDHLGNAVSMQIVTTNGMYTFTGLRPSGIGGYTITEVNQPANLADGRDTPGTPFGGTGTLGATPRDADAITNVTIPLGSNTAGVNYNFGEVPPATIGNFVWNDRNGNGRQDAGESGIDGVAVTLTGTNPGGAPFTMTTTTAGGGLYSFTNLRPGSYTLTFTAPGGYVFTVRDSVVATDATDSDAVRATGQTPPFTLAVGQSDQTRDAGLYQPASVGDFVWYDINADGIQDAGEPGIPGVTVILDYAGLDGTFGTTDDVLGTATQQTTSAGGYLFANLRPGTYRVRVDATTLPNGITSPTFDFDGVTTSNRARTPLVSGQNNLDVDFGYTVPAGRTNQLGDLVWYDSNRDGSSVGEPGIGGVTVTATWFGFDGVEGGGDDIAFTHTTDTRGSYGFSSLPFGNYRVTVDRNTISSVAIPTYDLDSGTTNPDDTTLASLTPLKPTELRADFGYFVLPAFGDRIWLDLNGDGIQDPGEPGISGVTVTAVWAGNDGTFGTGDEQTFTQTTGANGRYVFLSTPPGLYQVSVTAGLPPAVTNTGDPDLIKNGATVFSLGDNQLRLDIDFGYQGNNSLAGFVYRDFNVNGLREPTAAKPETGIVGVAITLNATFVTTGQQLIFTTTTAADGSYFFDGLPDGAYRIVETQPPSVFTAGQAGYYDGLDTIGSAGGITPVKNQFLVTFTADINGVDYNFGENPPADPFGFVYIDLNDNAILEPGEPGIPGVAVTVSGTAFAGTPLEHPLTAADIPGGQLTAFTDANGRWEFPILPPGLYSFVETQPVGYIDGREQDADPNGPPTTVGNDRFDNVFLDPFPIRGPFNFGELAANSSIAGSVYIDTNNNAMRDPGEIPIPGATVTLTGTDVAGRSVFATVVTDGNGNYLFRGMFAGTYTLTETQPPNFLDGRDRAGTLGGIAGNDIITTIPVGLQQNGVLYEFGELGLANPSKFWLLSTTDMSQLFGSPGSGVTDVNPIPGGSTPQPSILVDSPPARLVTRTPGGTTAQLFDFGAATPRLNINPFPGFDGRLTFAQADVTGDGIADLLVATAEGASHVKVFDGQTGAEIRSFLAFPGYNGGLSLAAGDVDGDGYADIIVATATGASHVKAFSGRTGDLLASFLAFPGYAGGVQVTAGDENGDGRADVAVAPLHGSSHIEVFDIASGQLLQSFMAFDGFAGDITFAFEPTLGIPARLAVGTATNNSAIKVFGGGQLLDSYLAYPGFGGGVQLTFGAANADGLNDVITLANGTDHVKVFDDETELASFLAMPPAGTDLAESLLWFACQRLA
jgi:fimbrial isopeptide formation D2 family protein/uncharacterized repeat protein (TIGR01451 family)